MKLSKREIVMLVALILLAVFFVEFRFIITPGIARYDELKLKEQQLQGQVDTIKLNLAIAKQNEQKRDSNLDEIKTLARRYYGQLQMDALLVRTHDLFTGQNFQPTQYQIYEVQSLPLSPQQVGTFDLSYELKNLAATYNQLNEKVESDAEEPIDENPDPGSDPAAALSDQVEQFQLVITAFGTYDQIKGILDQINGLDRSVVISGITMTPDTVTPGIDLQITIHYYGITKIVPTPDDFNTWYRESFTGGIENPFKPPLVTEETTVETAVP